MSITAFSGPVISFGQAPYADYNPEVGPSLFTNGTGILDPRQQFTYEPGQALGNITAGWLGTNRILTVNGIPMTLSATIIAAANNVVSGTPMTLQSTTTDGRSATTTINRADTGAAVSVIELDPPVAVATASASSGATTLNVTAMTAPGGHTYNRIAIGMVVSGTGIATGTTVVGFGTGGGGIGTYILSAATTAVISSGTITFRGAGTTNLAPFGQAGTIQLWNPSCMISRAVSVTCNNASGTGGVFTVRGFDVYGLPMTEALTSAPGSALTVNGKKAFKYIYSVTPGFTDATYTYSVGTQDVIGLPLRSDYFQPGTDVDVAFMANNAAITSTTGYTAADVATPTATTGDVRGTYALQTAANGTLRFVVTQSPCLANIASTTGLYGNTQYSDF